MSKFIISLAIAVFAILIPDRTDAGEKTGEAPPLRLPSVIGDNMVLQQGMPVPIWGWVSPSADVSVSFAGKTWRAKADSEGRWEIKIGPFATSCEPSEMQVAVDDPGRGKHTETIRGILVGEVWLCSGQSNMEMTLSQAAGAKEAVGNASYPLIRLLTVPRASALSPARDFKAQWETCSPATAARFSAVGFSFGETLHSELKVPIGLINASSGGSPIESWTGIEGLRAAPAFASAAAAVQRDVESSGRWPMELSEDDSTWMQAEVDEGQWREIVLPLYFDYALHPVEYDGVIWARKAVEIPEAWAGKALRLDIGKVDDFETTYFNGVEVGRTSTHDLKPRSYEVPGDLVKAGRAVLAVRVAKIGWGGIFGPADGMRLSLAGGPDSMPLAGPWKYRPARLEFRDYSPRLGTGSFNAMIAPCIPFAIRGAIWYQGEANANPATAHSYREMFPAMVRDWRGRWGQGDFPFYFVQLANYMERAGDPNKISHWAMLRESQMKALALPRTGMAVAIDVGEASDIHPKEKRAVGRRLARWALEHDYGRPIESSGPLYEKMVVEGGGIRVSFAHGEGLKAAGKSALTGFAISGADRKFHGAEARIDGSAVVVSSPEVAEPAAVRYGWADNPECNLFNSEDLPASPFRSDAW